MIDLMPNMTFFVQLGVFLVSLIFMNYLIFRPVLRLVARRKEITEGFRGEAEHLDGETEQLVAQYEENLRKAREDGLVEKGVLTKQGEEEGRLLLGQVRGQIDQSLENNRREIVAQSKEAQLSLRKHSRDLSEEMAEKLLGRKVST